jgi:tetratricopeptide (TPR) repeat protein
MAVSLAEHWLAETKVPSEHVRADQCLGMMLTQQNDFTGAMGAFADAVSLIPASQAVGAVPLMAMAGNAALGAGKPQDALTWLDRALAVPGFADNPARAAMLNDRARALVALGRTADAATALGQAHTLAPDNAESWLLSATLARRDKNLTQAQHDIETAARLDPRNPAIGVEAGVIAELGQREDAARQSWQSVVAMAPDSDEAQVARGYLEQIGAAPTSASPQKGASRGHHPMKLSVLDLVPVIEGGTVGQALATPRSGQGRRRSRLQPLLGGRAPRHARHCRGGRLGRARPCRPARSRSAWARAGSCCPTTTRW